MERKSTASIDNHHFSNLKGFGLVELMVCVAIAGFLGLGLWDLMGSQSKAYQLQDNTVGMQQNLRVSVDTVSRGLMNAACVGGGTNRIDISSYVGANICALNAQGNANATTIALRTGEGVNFPVGTLINVKGLENMTVTAVNGDQLTVDHGLQGTYPTGSLVRAVAVVTRYAVDGSNNLTVTEGGVTTTIATNISRLALTTDPNHPALLSFALDGRTGGAIPITSTIQNSVWARNAG